MFGKESSEVMEITEYIPSEKLVEEANSNGMHYITEWNFSEEKGNTTVSVNFTGKAKTIPAKLLNLLFLFMAGSMKKAFLTDMEELKNKLEKFKSIQ